MLEIVILAMVAAFLGLRLYSVLGRRAEHEEEVIPTAFERNPRPEERAALPQPAELPRAERQITGAAHGLQNAQTGRFDKIAADFFTRKTGPFNDGNRNAPPRQRPPHGRASRATADDYCVKPAQSCHSFPQHTSKCALDPPADCSPRGGIASVTSCAKETGP